MLQENNKRYNLDSEKSLKSFNSFDWRALESTVPILGVDEVGRGCLAGPVFAGAVLLREDRPWVHYTDSKKLSESRRNEYEKQIQRDHFASVALATEEEINQINILQASLLAMKRAILALMERCSFSTVHLLIDGNQKIPGLFAGQPGREGKESVECLVKQTTLIKGDLRAQPVAAASIVAKVARDKFLTSLGKKYPAYGFEKHKGYATLSHRQAIIQFGPCPAHRRTFAGVREYWPEDQILT